ncbi:MAG: hypothetical protein KF767_03375 [Bdellovibrionaceae bacterium]|nr:hypothetical protein [Pseudobdellovibrionaceae bacterium]
MNYVNGNVNSENIKSTAKKGAQQAKDFAADVESEAKSAVSKIEDYTADMQSMVKARWADIADNAQAYREVAEGYVKKNPATTILGAAALGLVAGSLLTLALRPSRK